MHIRHPGSPFVPRFHALLSAITRHYTLRDETVAGLPRRGNWRCTVRPKSIPASTVTTTICASFLRWKRVASTWRFFDEGFHGVVFLLSDRTIANTLMLFVFCLFGVGWEGERSTPTKREKYIIVDFSAVMPWLNRDFMGLNFTLADEEKKALHLHE
jgi:hypothetical protein